jgi:hypothetical protein
MADEAVSGMADEADRRFVDEAVPMFVGAAGADSLVGETDTVPDGADVAPGVAKREV